MGSLKLCYTTGRRTVDYTASQRHISLLAPSKRKRRAGKKIYAAVRCAIPLSAAAIREHNVKCHSESVSSAALSQEKARRSGGARKHRAKTNPIGPARFSNMRGNIV